ncbi:MAG: sigma-54-dependent transcriptional regulator [Bradymonadaceae bacterium]
MVSESAAMQEVYATLNDWVPHGFPVLVAGEAGTGKSLLARALHHLGPRSEEAYLTVNCRELSDEALDLELFGCTESELVDAVAPRKGVFELAEGGTVFLEEVEQLPRSTQEGLLRLLREDEVRRIGGAVGRPVDARLVASTRRDLEALVDRGGFRRDLFVLLREHMLEVPPLRRRQPDILPLARVYLSTFAQRYGRRCRDVSDAVAERFREHRWPGNARELKTAIETAVLNAQDDEVLREEHFGW